MFLNPTQIKHQTNEKKRKISDLKKSWGETNSCFQVPVGLKVYATMSQRDVNILPTNEI